ncbi:MAG: Na(+)-translocating NADH-quinone reductase subunit C [Desulfobulbaceae bacterium]|nr:Na(+)-translocating NADH-quinone reductase subunit C [Desulfobulbaceae bacterium]
MTNDSAAKSFYTVLLLALVCSALVSGAAVGLRPRQDANEQLDQKKNILRAAGLYNGQGDINLLFSAIETKIIRLSDGTFVSKEEVDPNNFNQLKAAFNPQTGKQLPKQEDPARLNRLEKYSLIYLVHQNNTINTVILPIRGKGLWSTMYGYVALAGDLSTITGVTFYKHGETPGLGGEIENQDWQAGWQGKKIHDNQGKIVLRVVKGKVKATDQDRAHRLDGISGATLTMNGINNLLMFWFGEHGFKPFLERYKTKEGIGG